MSSLMDSVNTQVNRAVDEAISVQILPQIQNMIRELKESTQGPSQPEGPELRPEQPIPLNSVSSSKNDLFNKNIHQDSHYMELPISQMWFLSSSPDEPSRNLLSITQSLSLTTTQQWRQRFHFEKYNKLKPLANNQIQYKNLLTCWLECKKAILTRT